MLSLDGFMRGHKLAFVIDVSEGMSDLGGRMLLQLKATQVMK